MAANNPYSKERVGSKFTVQQRRELRTQAWQMHKQGMSQLNIASELDVTQATVCYWLCRERLERKDA
jgi:orotate phosphoribosyltransferase-like protein